MKVIKTLEKTPEMQKPCGMTLGSFDGMHLGHLALIQDLKELVEGGSTGVFTFSNHPSHVLKIRQPTPLLCTMEHKLLLLKKAHVDLVILRAFDEEFSNIPYDVFLKDIRKHYPFSYFLVGKGASFGKDKQGDESHISEIAKKLKFKPKYMKKFSFNQQPVSSGFIRHLIDGGDFTYASKLLGRPFSIYTKIDQDVPDSGVYRMPLQGLCMPPQGSYAISLIYKEKEYPGTAFLDRNSAEIKFKLDNFQENGSGSISELVFHKYLNHEMLLQF